VPPAFLCVSIDCECDKGPGWRTRRPLSFGGVHQGIVERLQPLFAAHGAKPTYLLSPELLRDAAAVDRLSAVTGCELGTHLHGELAEPGAFVPDVTSAVQRDYPPEIERAKLASLTESFRGTFGRAPLSFRAGRFGIGRNTTAFLQDLGYAVESSVTPHVDWGHVSPGLSFRGAPTQPYRMDHGNPALPGDGALLEVPVTIVPRALARLPWVGGLLEPRWLRPTRASGAALIRTARDAIAGAHRERPGKPVVLNAMLHNVEVVAGASPYARTDGEARAILQHLGALLSWAKSEGIAFIGLADVPAVPGLA
jgi:hypothetical protein